MMTQANEHSPARARGASPSRGKRCERCSGRGFFWGRTRTGEKGRMAKRTCAICSGTGKVKVKP